MKNSYHFQKIEAHWQACWAQEREPEEDRSRPSFYCLSAIQDPGPNGLTIGHLRSYIAVDVLARFKQMQGYAVLNPIAWDSFGLPVQRAAERTGLPYTTISRGYDDRACHQLRRTGLVIDPAREIRTSDSAYYRWTQYGFLLLYRRGLLYRGLGMTYHCQHCQQPRTNSEVHGKQCAFCGSSIEVTFTRHWFVALSSLAAELEQGLPTLDWPAEIIRTQRAWLDRREGYIIHLSTGTTPLEVFLQDLSWFHDLQFVVVDLGTPLASSLLTTEQQAILQTRLAHSSSADLKRGQSVGVLSSAHVRHPISGQPIPIVITTNGRPPSGIGIRAGVPHYSAADATLAHACGLDESSFSPHTDLSPQELFARHIVEPTVRYAVRHWRIGRDRHWGVPVPFIHCPHCGSVPYPEDRLPLLTNEQPGTCNTAVACSQCGAAAERDPATISPFACTSWYFLRAPDPACQSAPVAAESQFWLPVDVYVGATRHALLHLLLARMWTRIWYDAGLIRITEPFSTILAYGTIAGSDGQRMSRSQGNVVWVRDALEEAGADALRMALLQSGALSSNIRWQPRALSRASRLLRTIWQLATDEFSSEQDAFCGQGDNACRTAHQTVTQALEKRQFHLALAALMRLLHQLQRLSGAIPASEWRRSIDHFLCLLAPFAPHLCEELWMQRGHSGSIHRHIWQQFDKEEVTT